MILRLWRARLRPGTESQLLQRLRELVWAQAGTSGGPIDFAFGFRHEGGATSFMSLSVWPSFADLVAMTGPDLARPVRGIVLDDIAEADDAGTFERLPPAPKRVELSEGRVIATVTGTVRPNLESTVQAMIDRSSKLALDQGALAAHLGRRLGETATEIMVAVVWPDRETLSRFARSREVGALDPRFTDQLDAWSFETYDVIARDRLLVPPAGPAVLVVTPDGSIADASPGIERVLGVPGVLLLGRSLADLFVAAEAPGPAGLRPDPEAPVPVKRPDGELATVTIPAMTSLSGGRQAIVLALPGESDAVDVRLAEIASWAAAGFEGAAPGGAGAAAASTGRS